MDGDGLGGMLMGIKVDISGHELSDTCDQIDNGQI